MKPEITVPSKISTDKNVDILSVFTFVFSFVSILQAAKIYHSIKPKINQMSLVSFDMILFISLLISQIYSIILPHRTSSLIVLCITYLICLVYQGSQSNHTIMGYIIAFAVLLEYSPKRKIWQQRLSGTIYFVLIILYLISFIHKLNVDFFNTKYSCSSLFSSGFLSMLLDIPSDENSSSFYYSFAKFIIDSAPLAGTLVEMLLPSLLILWKITPPKISLVIFKVLFIIAALFHLVICLPLPPMSVYPFSMVMVPMYVLLLPNESIANIKKLTSNVWIFGAFILLISFSVQKILKSVLRGEEMPLEYPNYGIWTYGIIWNLSVWAVILYAVLTVGIPSSNSENNENDTSDKDASDSNIKICNQKDIKLNINVFPTFYHRKQGILLAFLLACIGICPYLGIRNYPALAMFSNLRTEGTNINHLVLPSMDMIHYQSDIVTIHSTDLNPLYHYQVNLAIYFSKHTKKFNDFFNVTNEFWISPPSWKPPDSRVAPYQSYSIPFIEFRKHISQSVIKGQIFYVNFTRNDNDVNSMEMFNSTDETSLSLYRDLIAPISWFELSFIRFRSFDATYSPCRH